jgi:hypothetical protein
MSNNNHGSSYSHEAHLPQVPQKRGWDDSSAELDDLDDKRVV